LLRLARARQRLAALVSSCVIGVDVDPRLIEMVGRRAGGLSQ